MEDGAALVASRARSVFINIDDDDDLCSLLLAFGSGSADTRIYQNFVPLDTKVTAKRVSDLICFFSLIEKKTEKEFEEGEREWHSFRLWSSTLRRDRKIDRQRVE